MKIEIKRLLITQQTCFSTVGSLFPTTLLPTEKTQKTSHLCSERRDCGFGDGCGCRRHGGDGGGSGGSTGSAGGRSQGDGRRRGRGRGGCGQRRRGGRCTHRRQTPGGDRALRSVRRLCRPRSVLHVLKDTTQEQLISKFCGKQTLLLVAIRERRQKMP